MRIVISVLCFMASVAVFLHGLVTEYRQSRESGPIAIVPTLPSAVGGAMMIFLGLFWLPAPVPWWVYVLSFFGVTAFYGFCINLANHRRKPGKRKPGSAT